MFWSYCSAASAGLRQTALLGSAVNPLSLKAVPAKISFDIVSFKRCAPGQVGSTKVDMPLDGDYIAYHCVNVSRLIYFAYWGSVNPYTIATGYPTWLDDEYYDFTAKVAPDNIAAWQKLDLSSRRVLMRRILADALKLKMKLVSTPEQVYALTVAKGGAKLTAYKDGDQTKLPDGRMQGSGRVDNSIGVTTYLQDWTMSLFAELLTAHYDRRVVDHTGLKGGFNFSTILLPGAGATHPSEHMPLPGEHTPSTPHGKSRSDRPLPRLEGAKAAVGRLAIDHVERPETN